MATTNLITGGSGMLGRALADQLRRHHQEVVSLSSFDADLRDYEATISLFRKLQPDVVYHAAAKVHGLMGNKMFPAEMFVDNVRINTNVVQAAQEVGVRKIVAISTVATYNNDLRMPISPDDIWSGPPHPAEAAYGHAKRAMLAHLEACAAQYGLKYAYAIMTNIYGPYDRFDATYGHVVPSLITKFFDAANKGQAVEVWGSGRAERDFIFSEDAAAALVAVADEYEGAINIATGQVYTVRALVELLQEISGVPDVVWDISKPDGQLLRKYDIRALADLDFLPRVTLAEGIRRTYDWYAENSVTARH